MKSKQPCGLCAAIRAHLRAHFVFYIPWAILVAGGIAAAIPTSNEAWDRGSAYLIAFSLVWFVLAIFSRRLRGIEIRH
ncbi:MAG TPA: hypothetical protein VFB31_01340 [Pseudolabrys sp.]|nr:hypothetical protein [Pseudolabrys sp.]